MDDSAGAWAKALFAALGSDLERERCALALEAAAAALSREGAAGRFFADPAFAQSGKAALLASLAEGEGGEEPPPSYRRFVELLCAKRRLALLPAIATAFRAALDVEAGIVRARLVSARPLSADLVARLAAAWARMSGAAICAMACDVDAALIGGFVIEGGGMRLDHSIAGRFERLRRHLIRSRAIGAEKRGDCAEES